MSAADAVTAAEARALLDAVEGLSGPALFTTKRWTTSPEEAAALRAAGALFAAAPDLARTVIALHEEVGRLREVNQAPERRPSEAAIRYDAERGLLLYLWAAIDGEQDGDAPGNRELRGNLVKRVREQIQGAERERDALAGEVERLRHMRDAIAEDHEECSQYRNWLANPARVGRCHVCDLLHSEPEPTP